MKRGFTIVELLIVIVVIAILASISVVAYNGIQTRAKDSARSQDIKTIVQALEMHYADRGFFPNQSTYTPGSTAINGAWSTTVDGSWANLAAVLAPYISKLPTPPGTLSTATAVNGGGGNSYDYYGFTNSTYCASSQGQGFILVYRNDGPQANTLQGACGGTPVGPYGNASNFRVVK